MSNPQNNSDILIFSEKTHLNLIEVFETPLQGKLLKLNHIPAFSEASLLPYFEMKIHPACFLHPNPKQVLVLGGGLGAEVQQLLKHTTLQTIKVIEADGSLPNVAQEYFGNIGSCLKNPRVKLVIENESSWLQESSESFDLIFLNSKIKNIDFNLIKKRLHPDGIFIAPAGNSFFELQHQHHQAQSLKKYFHRLHFYNVPTLTEWGGLTSFALASESIHPIDDLNRSKIISSGLSFFYYNLGVHEASFALPEFQKINLESYLNPL